MDSEYLNILGTVTEHLRSRGYDVKINNGKKKIRPRTLKGSCHSCPRIKWC